MTLASLARAALLSLGAAVSVPWSAGAQTPATTRPEEPRPVQETDPADPMTGARRRFPTLFGGAALEDRQTNGLRFDGAIAAAWDENLLAEFAGPNTTTALQISGLYTHVAGDLRYTRRTNRLQVAATGGGSARYYTNIGAFAANDFHGGAGTTVRLGRASTLDINQSLSYAPVFLFGLFADVLPPVLGGVDIPNTAYAVNDDRAITSNSRVDLEHRFSVRSLATARAAYSRSHFTVVTPRGTDFTSIDAGGDYRYRLTENADLRLGYFYRAANFIGTEQFGVRPQQPAEHNLHFGVAFHPTLTEERRTILTFEGGTSLVNSALATNAFETRRQIRLVGDAALAHQMGRTWLAVGAYKRGTGFVQGLNGPVFIDAVSLTTTGFVNARTDLHLSAAYSNGEPTLVGAVQNFSTATVDARVRVALTPRWALTGQYVFYRYDFTDVLGLAVGLEPVVKRNTLRVGVNMWWPLR